eukprot:gb/GFBE01008438.1/.p1 GENE.gb/GFBE01008438.1/~~gb/GFBE01008438.1/.p1  ORF type:complete len:313 (+),score=72.48 gb/GFBE01008438.1/:1-939(+)
MGQAILVCAGVAGLILLFLIYSAWGVLEPWEVGLDYNMVTQSVSEDAWGSGRHWIGVGHTFVRFPSTVITVQFSHDVADSSGGPLRSRTSDGLEVSLEISFQYQIQRDSLYKMYTTFGPEYHDLFVKMGMDLLTVASTKHPARAFFVNRTMIGNMMEETLRGHFRTAAFVEVPLFQFQAVSLPQEFEAAIKETQVAEQKIKRMQAQQRMRIVEYETEVIQAQRYTKVRQQEATGIAESIALKNAAEIQSLNASQICAATAFERVLELFHGDTSELLKYMKVRAMRDHPSSHSILGIKDDIDLPHRTGEPVNV